MTEPTTIRTERLLLRPFSFRDVDDVLAYASDPEWSRFLPVPSPYTIKDAEEFVARRVLRIADEGEGFAIESGGVVVGAIALRVEPAASLASLHYSIARKLWNRGLMTEAAQAVVDWGFEEFGLAKIYSWADVENVGSCRVMEKVGMTREGTLRNHGVDRTVRQDYHYYGILRCEWENGRR